MEGTIIANYLLTRLLGRGGMGAVYEAVHLRIGKTAAIKLLHSQVAALPEVAARFLNEARAVNIIDHPGLVQIFEFGQLPDGTAFIVMELLRGESLARRLSRGPLPIGDAVRIAQQVALTLAAAHDRRIFHRDLKPGNVMLRSEDELALIDFGMAKDAGLAFELTDQGLIFGTPHYMSPEQGHGQKLDARSDLYSLGVMLYEMLTGAKPHEGESPIQVAYKHVHEDIPAA